MKGPGKFLKQSITLRIGCPCCMIVQNRYCTPIYDDGT